MRFVLPEEYQGPSVSLQTVVQYGLGLKEADGLKREALRIKERIKVEMRGKHGISVNGRSVSPQDYLKLYLKEAQSPAGTPYLEANIIVAARQEGAHGLESTL